MAKNPDLQRAVNRFTWGVLDTLSDVTLFQIALMGAALTTSGGHTAHTTGKIFAKAKRVYHELSPEFKPSQVRNALQQMRRKGLINTIKSKHYEAYITKRGQAQLKCHLPQYQQNRPWDKRIYLVSYDIPETNKTIRDQLRKYLQQVKCATLHKSLYISIYNPRGLLREWSENYIKSGEVLISDMGADGALGETSLKELVIRAFGLQSLNDQYQNFLHQFPLSSRHQLVTRSQAFFCFNGILTHDPQLPFELLPDWWLGDKAWRRFTAITGKHINSLINDQR